MSAVRDRWGNTTVFTYTTGTAQLYYVRRRWYDPQSRSFLSEDPLGLSGGRNTYAYADNDPVNGWDPSGLTMAPVITTASCWGFVECGGNPEGGSGWGITDVLNGLSAGGGGGGTGGLHGGGGGGGGLASKVTAAVKRIHFRPDAECGTRALIAGGNLALDIIGAGETKDAILGLTKAGVAAAEAGGLPLTLDFARNYGFQSVSRAYRYLGAVAYTQPAPATVRLSLDEQRMLPFQTADPEFSVWDLVPFVGTGRSIYSALKACFYIQ